MTRYMATMTYRMDANSTDYRSYTAGIEVLSDDEAARRIANGDGDEWLVPVDKFNSLARYVGIYATRGDALAALTANGPPVPLWHISAPEMPGRYMFSPHRPKLRGGERVVAAFSE